MARLDARLEAGEAVVFRTRLHPIVLAGTIGLAAFVAGVTALIVMRNDLPGETIVRLWVAAAAVAAVAFVSPLARWRTFELLLTARRVLATVRVFRERAVDLPLREVEAVTVDRTLGGRLLGYGTVHVFARGDGVETFARVAQAEALREAILRQLPSRAARAR
jgi:uncharacterized membrane protein YdbT with pleckstrin-like domain